jgi:hypothetical protein
MDLIALAFYKKFIYILEQFRSHQS